MVHMAIKVEQQLKRKAPYELGNILALIQHRTQIRAKRVKSLKLKADTSKDKKNGGVSNQGKSNS